MAGSTAAAASSNSNVLVIQPPSAASAGTLPSSECAPGVYTGMYEIELLGAGPITFELMPGMQSRSGACEEFCPDLVLTSEGGQFHAAWGGFIGKAGLSGGLDCRTGEFRAEMVDGTFGLDLDASGNPDDTLDTGTMTGTCVGRVDAAKGAAIAGEITCLASEFAEIKGMFAVTRAP